MKRIRKGANAQSGQIRIIAGKHRGRRLPVIDLDGLRPTTDKHKETLFNWLMLDVTESNCLDIFAGAGSLGFESLSRGANSVVMIEKSKPAAKQLNDNMTTLGYTHQDALIVCGDALKMLSQASVKDKGPFDIVFIDPPFQHGLIQPCIDLIVAHINLNANAKIYVESEPAHTLFKVPNTWKMIKQGNSQQTDTRLFEYQPSRQ